MVVLFAVVCAQKGREVGYSSGGRCGRRDEAVDVDVDVDVDEGVDAVAEVADLVVMRGMLKWTRLVLWMIKCISDGQERGRASPWPRYGLVAQQCVA